MTSDSELPQSETGGTDVGALVPATGVSSPAAAPPAATPAPKKKAAPKVTAEMLQRRREGRIKAAATIANNLKKTGIGRFEEENKFALTNVRQIPLVNQKNYFADYLKKDEQISFVRNWRSEKLMQSQNSHKLKRIKRDETPANGLAKNFDDYNLNDIEAEMEKKKREADMAAAEAAAAAAAATSTAGGDDDDDDDDDDEDADGEISEEKAKMGFDTIVIQPGSSTIRIGRATDAFPLTVPTVIATRPKSRQPRAPREPWPERTQDDQGNIRFSEHFDRYMEIVTKDFKARMKYYKRRILPNSRELAANFNKKQEPERIPDHNDPYKKEWLDLDDPQYRDQEVFVGEDALKLPIVNDDWVLRFPIQNGNFNDFEDHLTATDPNGYQTWQEIVGDVVCIVLDSLARLDITRKSQLSGLKALLVIPDLYDKVYVETWCQLLFQHVGFGKVAIIQEAVAATFGAGAQSACVVDVGAQTTTIACVDEGLIINDLRILLNYGGDHITETFIKLLLQLSFPYKQIDLKSRNDDWELAESLKKSYVTFQDADIAVQLYNFYKRKPNLLTEKYDFKVFDEVMIAPLGLFYPGLFEQEEHQDQGRQAKLLFPQSVDQYSGKPNNPFSKAQENVSTSVVHADMADDQLLILIVEERNRIKLANPYSKPKPTKTSAKLNAKLHKVQVPLEKAIIESITNAGIATDFSKVKRLYDNLLIVGGGLGKIPGFDLLLTDRINIWRPKFLSLLAMDEIMEYVTNEVAANDKKKQDLISEYKSAKSAKKPAGEANGHSSPAPKVEADELDDDAPAPTNIDDVDLDPKEIAQINKATELELDLDYIDSISDKGPLLLINVLPPPREFDPEVLTWKGGSVYARLKVINEMWVTQNDWDLLQSRCLYYKSLFNY
jgi:actin-related protein 8